MNKTITTILLLLALSLAATAQQPVVFYYQGEPVGNGAAINIKAEADDWGELSCQTNPPTDAANGLVLRNISAADFSGTATLTITKRTMQPSLVQWCMGGQCVPITTDTYDKAFTVPAGGSIMVQLDAVPAQYGEMQAQISILYDEVHTLTVSILFLHPDPDGLTFVRRSVVEEYTGTWCANCPRGIVGLQRLSEQFGDRCIPIAIHCGAENAEPMIIPAYIDVRPGDGIPCCEIDRGGKLDPYKGSRTGYHYYIDRDFQARLDQPTEAGVELVAQWNDEWQLDVRYDVTTTFNIDSDDAPYRLAFVLVEDGMKGTGSSWAQQNFFSTAAGYDDSKTYLDDDMKWWRDAPYYVTDIEYNHVAVNTLGIKTGIQGSVQAPIVYGQPQQYSGTVTTLTAKLIQDKSRLSAVAMLLNTETGRIVNAARADILPYGTTGIERLRDGEIERLRDGEIERLRDGEIERWRDGEIERLRDGGRTYDLQGRRISQPAKGLYIQDGKKLLK